MSVGVAALINAVTSHASALGLFDVVQGHEPKSAPGNGLTYAVYLQGMGPARAASGLQSASARVELTGRIYRPFISEPEDLIDPSLAVAADLLFTAYVGDFDLGGTARNVDVFGAHGRGLDSRAGYQTIGQTVFRVLDITIPIIVSDCWEEVA